MPDQALPQPNGFVDLDRRFLKWDEKEKPDVTATLSYTFGLSGGMPGVDWADLLKNRRAVVLGEPGSGKTREFRERARILQEAGGRAFFIRLDQLVNASLESALGPAEHAKYAAWLGGRGEATFLLDSVDEAKLHRAADFHSAVRRLGQELGPEGLARATIVLSSRISQWHPETDRREVVAELSMPARQEGSTDASGGATSRRVEVQPLHVVLLEPFDRDQVEKFARAQGIPDTDQFLAALDDAHAWEFARRPYDVLDLARFWRINRRLGSLTELIEFDVTQKLRESPERPESNVLSDSIARQAAEAMAAAAVLCSSSVFRVPDNASPADGIDGLACLPEGWPTNHYPGLLSRPIFDGASFGRIQFHHRRIVEYIAARWISARMAAGCSLRELEAIFFGSVNRERVLRRPLAPVAAWLCSGTEPWNESMRQWVLECAPAIHLRFGDPQQLTADYKRRLFARMVERATGRERLWIDSTPEMLQRLASPAIEPNVAAMAADRTIPEDLRGEMLGIGRQGRMRACVPVALAIVRSTDESNRLKSPAIALIAEVGSQEDLSALADIARQLPLLAEGLSRLFIETLFQGHISPTDVLSLLRKTTFAPSDFATFPSLVGMSLKRKLQPRSASEFLTGILGALSEPPHFAGEVGDIPISQRFAWMARLLPVFLRSVLSGESLGEDEIAAAVTTLQIIDQFARRHDHGSEDDESFDTLTKRHPEVRRQFIWRQVEVYRIKHGKEPTTLFLTLLTGSEPLLKPAPPDIEWLLGDLGQTSDPQARMLALVFTVEIWTGEHRPRRICGLIRKMIGREPVLLARFKELVRNGRWLPLRIFWYHKVANRYGNAWWWRRHADRFRAKWQRIREQWFLLRNLGALASGTRTNWLVNLSREADKESNDRWTVTKWDDLRRSRGRLIARAARTGCKRSWPLCLPQLPYERTEMNAVPNGVIAGLCGIQAAVADGEIDFHSLVPAEAERALRYAISEMNAFPPWCEDLVRAQPSAARRIFLECIGHEWNFTPDRQHVFEVTAKLLSHGDTFGPIVAEGVLERLRQGDPANAFVLEAALKLLLAIPVPPLAALGQVAAGRVRNGPLDRPSTAVWLAFWMQLAAGDAINWLETTDSEDPRVRELTVRMCSCLSGRGADSFPRLETPSYLSSEHLARLVPLIFERVRLAEDINRAGSGPYTPVARDDAQDFRAGLLRKLADDPSPATPDMLLRLADHPVLRTWRDWILHLLDENMETQSRSVAWLPEQIREFAQDNEVDPANDADLHKIALKRLDDLKMRVERGENSLREELHDDNEPKLRRWFARRLEETARNRYHVPQEEEIDQRRRPDIRFENPRTPPVPVELKWADSWSVNELYEALETQLFGDYLRDPRTRFGIFLLGFIGTKDHWEHPVDGRKLSFEDVVELLRIRAGELLRTHHSVRDVSVVVLDFRAPTSP